LELARVGWRFVGFHEKAQKIAKRMIWSTDLLRKGYNFMGHAVNRGQSFFPQNIGFMGVKFYVDFKNKTTLVTNCT
jgi:hypothetical protein